MHFRVYRVGVLFLLSYIGLDLDRTMVQSCNLVYLESDVEAIKWSLDMHLHMLSVYL